MSVQHAEAVIAATHKVHDEVWFRYWREGKKELTPRQVIDLIRDVRVKARIDEDALPEELLELLAAARIARERHDPASQAHRGAQVGVLAATCQALGLLFRRPASYEVAGHPRGCRV